MYDTIEEAKQKLEGTAVLFDDKPVYVVGVGGRKNVVHLQYQELPLKGSSEIKVAVISSSSWDFKSIAHKLGYVAVKCPEDGNWETIFTTRIPIRHSRQGLDSRTVQINHLSNDIKFNYSFSNLLQLETFNRTIQNKYPSVEDVFEKITDDPLMYRSLPIHRKLLLYYDRISPPYLVYRNEKIGYTEDGKLFKLAKHKTYLKEELVDIVGLNVA